MHKILGKEKVHELFQASYGVLEGKKFKYCTISFNSASHVTRYMCAEIFVSADGKYHSYINYFLALPLSFVSFLLLI